MRGAAAGKSAKLNSALAAFALLSDTSFDRLRIKTFA